MRRNLSTGETRPSRRVVIEAWPELREAIKAGNLALVNAPFSDNRWVVLG